MVVGGRGGCAFPLCTYSVFYAWLIHVDDVKTVWISVLRTLNLYFPGKRSVKLCENDSNPPGYHRAFVLRLLQLLHPTRTVFNLASSSIYLSVMLCKSGHRVGQGWS